MAYHDAGPVAFGRFRRYEKGFPDRNTRAIGKGGVDLGYRSDVAFGMRVVSSDLAAKKICPDCIHLNLGLFYFYSG